MNDQEFKKWENETFGYGYGTGESYTLPVLKRLFELFPESGPYDYAEIEKKIGAEIFWLLLTILMRSSEDILNYGSSPRYGWLDPKGKELKEYLATRTVDQLYDVVMSDGE